MDEQDKYWPEWKKPVTHSPQTSKKPPARIRDNFLKAVREIREPDPQLDLFVRKNGRASSGSRRPAVIQ
jgi:hypothetical protein